MVTKKKMLDLLNDTEFPFNTGRKNVLHKGQKGYYGMVLGRVKMMFGRGFAQSRHNKNHKELLKSSREFLKSHDPKYRFDAVTINKNHPAAKHVDKNNKGFSYIIGLGDYKGGDLVFESGPYKGVHNIKNKWLKFKGDHPHFVRKFTGQRYTLVYYHWK